MSYILEALRRAERERAQGELTGEAPSGAADADKKVRRSSLLIVLVALLAINAVVVAVFLLRPKENKAAPAAPATQASAPIPARALTAPAPPSEPAPPKHEEQAVVEENVNSLDDLGAQPEAQPDGEGTPASGSVPVEVPPPRKGGHVTIAKHPLTPEIPVPAPAPTAAAPQPEAQAPAESEAEPAAPPQPASPPPGEAKLLSDMPAAYQGNFPTISLEVHVYDANPDKRFAIIGGQRYREGQTLPEGPHLLQIVPAGLLVEFRGEKVIFPIGRH